MKNDSMTTITLKNIIESEINEKPNKIKFNIPIFDEMLEGGIEVGEITEFYGDPGCGKTQLVLQLALNCQLSFDSNAGRIVIFVTLEKRFPSKRIKQLRNFLQRKSRRKNFKFNIISLEFNTLFAFEKHLIPLIKKLTYKVVLVVFDMVDSIQREDSEGRSYFKCFKKLTEMAKKYKFAIVITRSTWEMSHIIALQRNWNARISKRIFITKTESIINLNIYGYENGIDMRVRKMKVRDSSKYCYFTVTPSGIESVKRKQR